MLFRSLKRGGVSARALKKTRTASKASLVDSGRLPPISPVVNSEPLRHKAESYLHVAPSKYDLDTEKNLLSELVDSGRLPPISPAVNSEPLMHKTESYLHVAPSKYDLGTEKNLPSDRVDNTGAVLCNAGLASAESQVASEMLKEPDGRLSRPLRAKRLRASTGKCLPSLKRTKKNSGSICKSPSLTMMPDPSNSTKVILDKNLVDSEMVESNDGSCFFVGEVVPEEEARQRWPYRYEKIHHFEEKVGIWPHCLFA